MVSILWADQVWLGDNIFRYAQLKGTTLALKIGTPRLGQVCLVTQCII